MSKAQRPGEYAETVNHFATEHGQIGAFKYCPQITQIKDGKTLAFRISEK